MAGRSAHRAASGPAGAPLAAPLHVAPAGPGSSPASARPGVAWPDRDDGRAMIRLVMSMTRYDEPMIRSYTLINESGTVQLPSRPGWQRLVWVASGGLVARTRTGRWTAPPGRILLLDPGVAPEVLSTTTHQAPIHCIQLAPTIARTGRGVAVVEPSPLGTALLDHLVESVPSQGRHGHEAALLTLLLDEVANRPDPLLSLPLPVDEMLSLVCDRVLDHPAAPLDSALDGVAASRRTIERRFNHDLGMTPIAWRRRARILRGVELLSTGRTVSEVAAVVGYTTASSFTHAFRMELGRSPTSLLARARP